MKMNLGSNKIGFFFSSVAVMFFSATLKISGQSRQISPESDDYTWWYVTLLILFMGLGAAIAWMLKSRKLEKENQVKQQIARKSREDYESGSLESAREMEWLRKNQKLIDKKRKMNTAKKNQQEQVSGFSEARANNGITGGEHESASSEDLPVFNFTGILPAKPFTPLPLSNDESLLSAIEQVHDEYEEDEEVRDLAVRILTAFKARNSVEALSQVALYDLSSTLRSKAILTLTEFDHESVFEPILIACADPTREVRAAAARGLTRLSFDRADAWARISQTGEKGRMRQAARAAMESGFVERSFDRLIHPDRYHAYEAFVLLSLLVKSGETKPIFNALRNHKDKNVQLAILHLLKVNREEEFLDELVGLSVDRGLSDDLRAEINKVVEEFSLAAV
jgi:hypothetical protein